MRTVRQGIWGIGRMRWLAGVMCMAGLAIVSAPRAKALGSGDEVRLVGTTVPGQAVHADGRIDVAVPGTLVFRANALAGKPASAELMMPYDKVFEFGVTSEDAFHLGFFPAMFYGMVAPRPKRHVFTVSWRDADGAGQEATFEVSKRLSEHLMPVMYARARGACVRREYGACTPVAPPPAPARVPLTGASAAATP